MSKVKFCVTGASGFIGTNFVGWAITNGHQVVNFDIRPPKILEHQEYWKYVDIRDYQQFSDALIEFAPTHIVHLAATTGMDVHNFSFFDANNSQMQHQNSYLPIQKMLVS